MIEIENLQKHYGSTVALNGLSLTVPAGGVFGVAGPNGAGKSTLVRILAAEEAEDEGTIGLDGKPWVAGDRQWAVAVVHQEPQLFPNFTVLQNLHFGQTLSGVGLPSVTAREREVLDALELAPFANRELSRCPLVVWQLTEIGRAVLREARLFLFDEPNSALNEEESARLFAQRRRLASNPGHIVVLVSHRLADLTEHCSQVAVLREGVCTELLSGAEISEHAIARALVVGRAGAVSARGAAAAEALQAARQPVATLRSWASTTGTFSPIDLDLQPGQLTAILGVEGSGGRELVRSVAGLESAQGTLKIAQEPGRSGQTVAYLPASRRNSLFFNYSIKANLCSRLGQPEIANRFGFLSLRRLRLRSEDLRKRFEVLTPSVQQPPSSLSGGNQQKVALAAAVATRPRILAIEEPTRGVDIGTKAEIYRTLREFARQGNSVLMFCTEVGEAYDAADVAYVMAGGRISDAIPVRTIPTLEELATAVATTSREMRDRRKSREPAAAAAPASAG